MSTKYQKIIAINDLDNESYIKLSDDLSVENGLLKTLTASYAKSASHAIISDLSLLSSHSISSSYALFSSYAESSSYSLFAETSSLSYHSWHSETSDFASRAFNADNAVNAETASYLYDGTVTYNKIQNVTAQRILGNADAIMSGPPHEISIGSGLTLTQQSPTLGTLSWEGNTSITQDVNGTTFTFTNLDLGNANTIYATNSSANIGTINLTTGFGNGRSVIVSVAKLSRGSVRVNTNGNELIILGRGKSATFIKQGTTIDKWVVLNTGDTFHTDSRNNNALSYGYSNSTSNLTGSYIEYGINNNVTATGSNQVSLVIGSTNTVNTSGSNATSIVIGRENNVTDRIPNGTPRSVVIGSFNGSISGSNVIIGYSSAVTGMNNILVGNNNDTNSIYTENSSIFGYNTQVRGRENAVFGYRIRRNSNDTISGSNLILIGNTISSTMNNSTQTIGIGNNLIFSESSSVLIGNNSTNSDNGILIGNNSTIDYGLRANNTIHSHVIGYNSYAKDSSLLMGDNSRSTDQSVVLGRFATASNQSISIHGGAYANNFSISIGIGTGKDINGNIKNTANTNVIGSLSGGDQNSNVLGYNTQVSSSAIAIGNNISGSAGTISIGNDTFNNVYGSITHGITLGLGGDKRYHRNLYWYGTTTNTTKTEIFLKGNETQTQRYTIPPSTIANIRMQFVGFDRNSGNATGVSGVREYMAYRQGTANVTASVTYQYTNNIGSRTDVIALEATSQNEIRLNITSTSGSNMGWVAMADVLEYTI